MNLSIGERIKLRRAELNISQAELAKAVGMGHQTSISKIEKGERGIPTKYLRILAEKLQTRPDYLLGNTDEPEAGSIPKFITQYTDNKLAEINAFATLLSEDNREKAVSFMTFLYQEQMRAVYAEKAQERSGLER